MTLTSPHIILITGGIGAGKSTVARIVALHGIPVYDTDSHAARILRADQAIHSHLRHCIGPHAIGEDGLPDRTVIARHLFAADSNLRHLIQHPIHQALRTHLLQWLQHNSAHPLLAVECAIPVTGGLMDIPHTIWYVTCPASIRIERIKKRNPSLPDNQILQRIHAQDQEYASLDNPVILPNDGNTPILPEINSLIQKIQNT